MSDASDSLDRCDECGFVYDLDAAGDAGDDIAATSAKISAILTAADDVTMRPDAGTWSVSNTDVMSATCCLSAARTVLLALRVEEPQLETMGHDEVSSTDGYRDQHPLDVARQVGATRHCCSPVCSLGSRSQRGTER